MRRLSWISGLIFTVTLHAASDKGAAPASAVADPSMASAPSVSAGRDFLVTPDDLLEIIVFDVPQMSRQYRVSPHGEIMFPLLAKPIMAAGKTPEQLSQAIANELRSAGMLSSPQVNVEVKESRLHSVAVTGAVKKPQIYQVFGRTTLLDVLSQAEGLAPEAGNTLVLTRGDAALRQFQPRSSSHSEGMTEEVAKTTTVDLKRLMETGDPALNLEVYPGDRVTVQRAGIVYVVGAVNRPGGFPMSNDQEEITVLKAVALAQDVKATAIRSKAVIIRKNANFPDGREEIPVDLKMVLARRAPDPAMQPSDILFVPDSPGKKAMGRIAEAAVQATVGIIVWRR
ncbi:MAG: polysaccharide biosynthesis/export family protein [Acidobacteria bacterium]|nr:polysaccharide biosynthesis/export family protein [Acidobacteriota bacterium]